MAVEIPPSLELSSSEKGKVETSSTPEVIVSIYDSILLFFGVRLLFYFSLTNKD